MLIDLEAPVRRSKEKWAQRWLKRKSPKEYLDSGKSSILCKCPKCGDCHYAFLQWTGRGMPRIFCADCRPLVSGIDDLNNHSGAGSLARGACKRPEHFFE